MTDAARVDLANLRLMIVRGSPSEKNVALDTLVLYAETLAAKVARLTDGLKDLEWSSRQRTVGETWMDFCPVCHGAPSHVRLNPHLAPRNGHRPACALADLLGYPPALPQEPGRLAASVVAPAVPTEPGEQ